MKKIPLTQGQFAIVDDEDYKRINSRKWYAWWNTHTRSFYAARSVRLAGGKRITELMHRIVVGDPRREDGTAFHVDHKNRNTLDNRRNNLRIDYERQNTQNSRKSSRNTSGYKGVFWHRGAGKWRAQIGVKGKHIHLGYFACRHEAAKAYNSAALKYHEEFALLNTIWGAYDLNI